ncbi:hypothetical protein KIN20_014534 [Parelaphostrongylus tenuis]|uniref:Uncharacterized protein n=1 Tax=Parelaphostrongylus tenuis TaxID=148309 RepID=A0AAD5MZC8_PARTN|nr:hypothetical protein KIN20_014534 [Parelaphostrongylus tenuis]
MGPTYFIMVEKDHYHERKLRKRKAIGNHVGAALPVHSGYPSTQVSKRNMNVVLQTNQCAKIGTSQASE